MLRTSLKTLYRLALVSGVLLALIFLLSGPPTAVQAPSAKPPQSPELAAPGRDADVTVSVGPASPLPEKMPAILLSEGTIQPSPLMGGVRNLPYVPPSPDTRPEFEIAPGAAKVNSHGPAPAAPSLVLGPMPAPLKTFDGLDFAHNGAGHPPDTNGDVGPTYYMQAVNTSIGIFNKQNGTLDASFTFNSFWAGAGTGTACDTTNQGDVVVLYDTQNDHWIFMDFAWTDLQNGPYYFCYGVSQTGDPLGNYWRYAIRADDASHPWLPDYPKGGVWPDGLYFSGNMFDCLNSTCSLVIYKEARAYALNLQKMEAGLSLTSKDVQAVDTSANYFTLMPSNARRSQPPVNTPNFFVSEDRSSNDWDVFKFHVDFNTPGNSSLSAPTQVSQTSYTAAAPSVAEPSPGNNIDTLADRMMFLNQYRRLNNSESLWVQHTVGTASTSTPTGIQWAQIDVSGGIVNTSPVQQQIFNNGSDGLNRFMGSLAVDQNGDVALGYSVASASLAPDIRYVGRLVGDPLGQMPRGETTLLGGVTRSVQTGNCGGSACIRWGDYSAMTVDPLDDCTFWYTNMYFPVQGTNWVTRIGSFKFPTCVNASITSLESQPNPSVFGQTVTLTATVVRNVTGLGMPSGVVSFTIGGELPVTVNLSNGIATLITNTLPAGTYPITATYGGDDNFGASQAVLVAHQTVNKAGTTTSLVLSPVPAFGSASLTITATVTTVAPGAGTPTGVITFTIDDVTAGTPALSATHVVTLTTPLLAPAAHNVDVTYGGDSNFNASSANSKVILSPYKLFMPFVDH
jgi:hypothetical protein